MKLSRKQVVAAAALLLILPVLGWCALLALGLVGAPGKKLEPPFNMSDRIVTIEVVESGDGELKARFDGWKEGEPELSGEEFFAEIHERTRDLPGIYKWLDVTSLAGVPAQDTPALEGGRFPAGSLVRTTPRTVGV